MPLTSTSDSAQTTLTPTAGPSGRLTSIDIFRGIIMVWMALDHARDFFTNVPFEPETLALTSPLLFATRWVTHFCAPMFFLLAGASAFLYGQRKSTAELQHFLWMRGVWLILLEFTVVGTAWTFQFPWGFFGVIWALGASMLILALVVRLPLLWITVASIAVIVVHNLLDSLLPQQFGSLAWLWTILHARGEIVLPFKVQEFVLFPLIPLAAVMTAGFAFGQVYRLDGARRRRFLLGLGLSLTLAFIFLRASNLYGNPPTGLGGVSQGPWHPQSTITRTIILFLDVEKYPPSLQFLLMTLGPSLLMLAALERESVARKFSAFLAFGRVPMFFYVLHLYLIHWMAVVVAVVCRQPVRWLFHGAVFSNTPEGYGHGLLFVYCMWLAAVAILYFPCRWFADLKRRRRDWWLSYL